MIYEAQPAVVLLFRETDGSPSPFTPEEIEKLATGVIVRRYRRLRNLGYLTLFLGLLLLPFVISLVVMIRWLSGVQEIGSPWTVGIGAGVGVICIITIISSVCLLLKAQLFHSRIDSLLELTQRFQSLRRAAKRRFEKLNARKTKLSRQRTALARYPGRLNQILYETEIEMSEIVRAANERHRRGRPKK